MGITPTCRLVDHYDLIQVVGRPRFYLLLPFVWLRVGLFIFSSCWMLSLLFVLSFRSRNMTGSASTPEC